MLKGIPVAWTPPTNGVLTAPIIVAPMSAEKDFAEWKGKLSGKIVLVTWPAPEKDDSTPPFERYSEADIAKLKHVRAAGVRSRGAQEADRALPLSVLVAAADADKPLARKPVPTEPKVTDPFAYPDPSRR